MVDLNEGQLEAIRRLLKVMGEMECQLQSRLIFTDMNIADDNGTPLGRVSATDDCEWVFTVGE